jgi:CubicO group peptidase (beta-lactamase class C family)
MKRSIVAVALIAFAAASPAWAAPAATTTDQAHIAVIETGLLPAVVIAGRPTPTRTLAAEMAANHTPGVSIAFFENGAIRWTRTYGLADVAAGRPVTAETLFQAASISKPVSATAALRLAQDGKLNLDEDVNVRLRGWKVPATAFTAERKVTLRGLLSHTAGLSQHGFPGYPPGHALPTPAQVLSGQAPANTPAVVSEAKPGERWSYSGGGYVVAQVLMTDVTGRAYPDLMRDLVLRPAGMTHSAYAQPLPDAMAGQAATGYFANGQPLPGGRYAYPELAPAGLWTNPSDLAHFAIALQNAYAGSSDRLLKPATARMMLTRGMGDFGLGLNVGPAGGPAMFEHGGSNQGFQSEMRAYLGGSRQGVVIMTNGDGGLVLIGEIVRAVAQTYGWAGQGPETRVVLSVPQAELATDAGDYVVAGVATLTVSAPGDGRLLVLAPPLGPKPFELLSDRPGHFFVLESGVTMEFIRDAAGAVSSARIGGPYGAYDAPRKR